MTIVFCYLLLINLVSFSMMGWDKHQARRGERRIPERRLFLFVALGGSIGGILGMYTFHHKTRHWYFKWGFPAILVLQLLLALTLCWLAGVFLPFRFIPAPPVLFFVP